MRALAIPAALVCVLAGPCRPAAAQVLPAEPIAIADGRLVLGGDAAIAIAPEDRGYFTYSDYDHSTLRSIRAALAAQWRASERLTVLGELRTENFESVRAYALYARIRPLRGRRVDVQVGRIPPTFGRFPRQAYSRDNPLIGSPLAYQYLTSLRPDALPASIDELLAMRGRGWLTTYSVGDRTPARGVPLVSTSAWDTGVQVTAGWRTVETSWAITTGTTANPLVRDDNGGKQIAARVAWRPAAAVAMGASVARGDFLARTAVSAAGAEGSFAQRALGLDLEYTLDRLTVRADGVFSRWQVPLAADRVTIAPAARAASLEARYGVAAGGYFAVRAEHLGFSRLTGATGSATWDAPVSRLEFGGGVRLRRNVQARLALQVNRRDGGRVTHKSLTAAQLLYWF